ncbi:MAG: hypothetical protein LBU74_07470 [Methanobacteriaceae archaeon]|jgi:hypothetical protein|nr:hypothetical protein [Candidatus Methanorudis spinitermitis]
MLKRLKKYPDKKPYSFRLSQSLMDKINIYCKHKNTTVPDLIGRLFEEEIKGLTLKRESTNTGILIMLPVFKDVNNFIKEKTNLIIYSYHDMNKLTGGDSQDYKESLIKTIDTRVQEQNINLKKGKYYFNKIIRLNNNLDILDNGNYKKKELKSGHVKHEGLNILRSWLVNYFIRYTYFINEDGFEEVLSINLISKKEAKKLSIESGNNELLSEIELLDPSNKKIIHEEEDLNDLVLKEIKELLK